jgi:type VI secretion system protein ImpI
MRLKNGDLLAIGHYIIGVALDGAADSADSAAESGGGAQASASELWSVGEEAPPPIDPRELKPAALQAHSPDFLDWAIDAPAPIGALESARGSGAAWQDDADWIRPVPPLRTVEPPVAPPLPHRLPTEDAEAPSHISEYNEPGISEAGWTPNRPAASDTSQRYAEKSQAADPSDNAFVSSFLHRFAESAGIPEEALASTDPEEFAGLLGGLMRSIAEEMMQLLHARYEAKRMARGIRQTMIQAVENNPLKFSPTPEEALRIMFGPSTRSYLDANRAFRQAFDDLKSHQINTLSAMQGAAKMLVEDLDPEAIEKGVKSDRGVAALLGSHKAKLWDAYVARWDAKARLHENGLLGAFMLYFPQCYDDGKES